MSENVTIDSLVAEILDAHRIALNKGANFGVTEGSSVVLYREVSVSDPETLEQLGVVKLVKLRLRVASVYEKMSVAVVSDRSEASVGATIGLSVTAESRTLVTIKDASEWGASKKPGVEVRVGEHAEIRLADPLV
ncbi:hypothetical protein [Aeromicrobium sp. Leaf350]|uniref:hypothetical protein n=1 Tax=Aeromicrobium sp. Leaf350 TaxID=2876565 RepID=UPI001E31AD97|nr:hypothetical protein [Aeromicrobium sp. Leaf350]